VTVTPSLEEGGYRGLVVNRDIESAAGELAAACCCAGPAVRRTATPRARPAWRPGHPALALALSALLAVFPKCPVCWAAYANLFGCAWLATAAGAAWILPVLIACAAGHALVLVRRAREHGYAPLWLSAAGAAAIVAGRATTNDHRLLLATGVGLVTSSAILSSWRRIGSMRQRRASRNHDDGGYS
jgi:hypothetical protein